MPNQLSKLVEQPVVAFALGHPQLGPYRIASELARDKWGGFGSSGKALTATGLLTPWTAKEGTNVTADSALVGQ
jgi:hypothetical protein